MAKEDKVSEASVEEPIVEIGEEEVTKPKKTSKKAESKSEPKMSIRQYFTKYRPDVSRYEVAYVSVQYKGTIKTKQEWDSLLG